MVKLAVRSRTAGRPFLLAAVILLSIILAACGGKAAARVNVTVAVYDWPGSAGLYVAAKKGFFKAEGLEANFVSYASGKLALGDVLAGQADIATAGDTPIAAAVLEGRPLAIIGTIAEAKHPALLIGRKDRGISEPASLKGKKIGYTSGTGAEFYLYLYLTTSYIGRNEVQLVDLPADRVADALAAGEVDAVSIFSPQALALLASLGPNGVVLHDTGIYSQTWNLVVTRGYTASNPEAVTRFLRAIVRANRFIVDHPEEARSLSSAYVNADSREWEDYQFEVALEQGLLLTLEEEARWMIKQSSDTGRETPNFLDYIYGDGLKAIAPASVRIVGK